MSARVFGSSGRRSDPLGIVAVIAGVLGAGMSAILWIYQVNPHATILGSYSGQVASGGQLADQLQVLALTFGAIAIIGALLSSVAGKRGGGLVVAALILGIAALSYPVMDWVGVVSSPLSNDFLNVS